MSSTFQVGDMILFYDMKWYSTIWNDKKKPIEEAQKVPG